MEDEFALENRNTFANNFWQAYAGYGAPSGRDTGVPIPASLIDGTISTNLTAVTTDSGALLLGVGREDGMLLIWPAP